MKLIITEKPSAMRLVAVALNAKEKQFPYALNNKEVIITHCSGHLYRSKLPNEIDPNRYSKWSMSNLPFRFDDIPLTSTDDAYVKGLIKNIKELLEIESIDEIVCAGDPDREGESIPREVVYSLEEKHSKIKKLNKNRTMTRMWFTETGPEHIFKAYNSRRAIEEYDNIYYSQKARAIADYKVGLTSTQAMTIKSGELMTIGRVQTPTLRIVVDLENEIRNFKSVDFFKVVAHTKENIDGECTVGRFKTKEAAQKVIEATTLGPAKVIKAETKESKQAAKKLYSMSTLQADMNRRYNLTAHQTLDIAQTLYEAGLTTYPRTEEEVISKAMAETLMAGMHNNIPIRKDILNIIKNNNYKLNKSVIAKGESFTGAHEAITPSSSFVSVDKINSLKDIERKVYYAIVERFLENFFPPALYDNQKIIFVRNDIEYEASFKALKEKGYLIVSNDAVELESIENVSEGDTLEIVELELVESKTMPPARFTEASLIETMKNPVKYLTDKDEKDIIKEVNGIGTGATRDTIIESLKKQGLIMLIKKTIHPTEKGMELIEKIPTELIKSVSLTAYFESKLKEIYEGKYSLEKFQKEIDDLMEEFVEEVKKLETKERKQTSPSSVSGKPVCKCPNCKNDIVKTEYGYFCGNKDCGVRIYINHLEKVLGYKKITEKQAKELLTKGITSKKVKLLSKNKKEYEAFLTYSYDKNEKYPNNVYIKF